MSEREMDEPQRAALEALVEPILSDRGMELVELTCRPAAGQRHVRLLVDRVGGVTIQQCAQVNQRLGEALEAAHLIEGSYTLEVSSPGLDRPLVTRRDFERALGEDLRVETRIEEDRSREVQGMLLAVQREAIVLKTVSGNLTVRLSDIRTAKKTLRW